MSRVELDPTSDRPLSLQLADLLREEITSGRRSPGSQLPTESGFYAKYAVSRTTVRAALAQLTGEGLVVTRKGFGSFVRDRPPIRRLSSHNRHASHRSSGKSIFETLALAQGQVPMRRMLEVAQVGAPSDIAKSLQISSGDSVVVRRRLHLIDGHPVTLSASYFPLWLARGTALESPDAIPEGPDGLIEALGHRLHHGIEILRACMPAPDEARMLRLDRGVPVVRMLRVEYDAEGRTLQVADDLYAGDRHEFAFEWTDPEASRTTATRSHDEHNRMVRELE